MFLVSFVFFANLFLILSISGYLRSQLAWRRLTAVIVILIANFMMVGHFIGFSVLLLFSVVLAMYYLVRTDGKDTFNNKCSVYLSERGEMV